MTIPNAELVDKAAIDTIVKLSADECISSDIEELGAKADDIPTLTENALKDACGFINPIQATAEEISEIFRAAM
ncbi:hypothetical protein CWB72_20290 [Pseudoalteromonas phenolica]|nr:hypothetical protein CWB72_20290 [Pseudoalteromonas phenolica]